MISGLTNRGGRWHGWDPRGRGDGCMAWDATHRAMSRSLAGTFPGTYRAIRFHLRIFVLNDPNGATVFT